MKRRKDLWKLFLSHLVRSYWLKLCLIKTMPVFVLCKHVLCNCIPDATRLPVKTSARVYWCWQLSTFHWLNKGVAPCTDGGFFLVHKFFFIRILNFIPHTWTRFFFFFWMQFIPCVHTGYGLLSHVVSYQIGAKIRLMDGSSHLHKDAAFNYSVYRHL